MQYHYSIHSHQDTGVLRYGDRWRRLDGSISLLINAISLFHSLTRRYRCTAIWRQMEEARRKYQSSYKCNITIPFTHTKIQVYCDKEKDGGG
ncbi:hypothetical protein DPMN_070680 [Dreissena polymorpha]|uniref:Uncharacterized protein n=1 Tax=Dreissena polymorpha TaxID=45954 RepID=A0A9D3Z6L9_DREPO|nr:hypothetical protein DPMN_070680 [Dreissena polymorpha]